MKLKKKLISNKSFLKLASDLATAELIFARFDLTTEMTISLLANKTVDDLSMKACDK